ncbi:MAG: phosphoglycerate kinase [Elusimicrobiota bacterium]
MAKKSITDIDLAGKKVLARVDYNVPLDENGNISDDTRIVGTIPTVKYLIEKQCKVILCAHLGRPKGKVDPKYSLRPVVKRLSELLGKDVKFAEDCVGDAAKSAAAALNSSEVLLLENLRFHAEEEENDENFAKELASLAEVFVQDAFGTVHRAHASTEGVTKYLPAVAGFLVQKEIEYLGKALEAPVRPFYAILGGAKVSDKIEVITNLLAKVDALVIGGAMAYTLLKAKGVNTGDSLVENDKVDLAKKIVEQATAKRVHLLLPIDHVVAKDVSAEAETMNTSGMDIPAGWKGLDIGPMTVKLYGEHLAKAKTVCWNGPLGVFEIDKFANGTFSIAKILAGITGKGAITIIGGGDTASAVVQAGVADKMSHISTGGGASLEFLEGKELPGIAALQNK